MLRGRTNSGRKENVEGTARRSLVPGLHLSVALVFTGKVKELS